MLPHRFGTSTVPRSGIDFLNGLVATKGQAMGMPAPIHAALTEVVKCVELGEIEAHPRHVEGP